MLPSSPGGRSHQDRAPTIGAAAGADHCPHVSCRCLGRRVRLRSDPADSADVAGAIIHGSGAAVDARGAPVTVSQDPLSGWGLSQMDEVEQVIRQVVDTAVLPAFGHLRAADITEKSPGELVTVADRRAEEALQDQLTRLLPGSTVVGEEGVGRDPGTATRLRGSAPVWVIDPIDGTENFIAGRGPVLHVGGIGLPRQPGRVVVACTADPVFGEGVDRQRDDRERTIGVCGSSPAESPAADGRPVETSMVDR